MNHLALLLRRTARRWVAALSIVALCATGSSEARADASAADKITAKTLFDAARALPSLPT
jgi:hypothetical protein